MPYEIWDMDSRTVVEAFDTEAAALATIRQAASAQGRTYAESFAMVREDPRGGSKTVARGAQLVDRAAKGVQRRLA